MQNANQTNNARLELIRASEIEPKEIDWLWGSGSPVATFAA